MDKDMRRSDIAIMRRLIVLVNPLTGVMITGIILGVAGFLCAIFLTIVGGIGVIKGLSVFGGDVMFGSTALDEVISWNQIFVLFDKHDCFKCTKPSRSDFKSAVQTEGIDS